MFIVIGGIFNAAEVAMISLRQSQVEQLAATKGRNGQLLEKLVSDPTQFLAAVQIGVTVATMLSSAFGAATVSENVAAWLVEMGMEPTVAEPVALVGVTLIISFCSLVLGELTPKRLGLQRSEAIALAGARPLSVLARLFTPVVWLLGRSSDLFVRLLGGNPKARGEVMGQDELRSLVLAHESLTSVERRMIVDVFHAETTRLREVMVPRPDVVFLPATMSLSRASRIALTHPHSRYPVIGHDSDEVVGVVHLRDLLSPSHPLGRAASVRRRLPSGHGDAGYQGRARCAAGDACGRGSPRGRGRRIRRHRRHRHPRGPGRGDRRRNGGAGGAAARRARCSRAACWRRSTAG